MKIYFTAILLFILPEILPAFPGRAFPDEILRDAFSKELSGDLKKARSLFETYLSFQNDPYVRSRYAALLNHLKKTDEALLQAKRSHENSRNQDISLLYVQLLIRSAKYKEAQKVLNEIASAGSSDPIIHFYRSEIFNRMGNHQDAEVACSVVLFRQEEIGWSSPRYVNLCLWRIADISIRQKKFERAGVYLMRFLKLNPESIYARFVLAYHVYFNSGKYRKAQKEFEILTEYSDKELKKNRVDPQLLSGLLGRIYLLNNDIRCRSYMKKSLSLSKNNSFQKILYRSCLNKEEEVYPVLKKRYDKKKVDLLTSVLVMRMMESREKPDYYARELLNNSVRFGTKNLHEYGLMFAKKALAVKQKYPGISIPLSLIYLRISLHYNEMKAYNRSLLFLRLSLKEDKTNSQDEAKTRRLELLAQNLAHSAVGRFSEAESIAHELIRNDPENDFPYFILGLVNLESGHLQKSLVNFSDALERNQKQHLYFFYRAVVYHSLGSRQEAEQDLLQVLSMNLKFPEALNFLGFIYAESGKQLDESLVLISKAIEFDPMNGVYRDSLGWVYFKMGRLEEARFHLELAAQILEEEGNEDPEVYDHLGDVLLEMNYPIKAEVFYRKSIEVINKNKNQKFLNQKQQNLRKKIESKLKLMKN
ncbi:MAG: hypothetical protein OEZ34_03945 [Spirochaetia bacterium]|nr:hypothetical protein [Spirochaetia bacterium]